MTMRFLRFIFPFLFQRNWYSGAWELSRARVILCLAGIVLVSIGIGIAYMLQAPVVYTTQ